MPKILRIINRFNLGGITYNVSFLSCYLAPKYETLLIGGPEEEGEDSSLFIPEQLGLKPVIIEEFQREISIKADYRAYKRIKQMIREFKPDIVHTHASKAGAVGRLAAAHCQVPVIVHTFHGHVFHSYFGKLKTRFYIAIERYLARKTHAIIAISEKQRRELTETFAIAPKEKFHVVPLGFDLGKFRNNKEENRKSFREKYHIDDSVLAIGIIGRLVPIKNHELFIKGIAYLKQHYTKPFRGIIIGDGETRPAIEDACRQYGLSFTNDPVQKTDILFTSWITNVDWALDGLDLVTLTSLNEGTPVSLIEAQASGKFVVTTNVGGIKDILHPDCGLLSEVADDVLYCNNLLKAAGDESMRQKAAQYGPEWALERFHYTRLVKDVDALYSALLKRE
ncbi:MAG: glycosyltransferase [Bacteroidetes bacterium]|nr:glycosyltransferase [Bacteroidota bacterium]